MGRASETAADIAIDAVAGTTIKRSLAMLMVPTAKRPALVSHLTRTACITWCETQADGSGDKCCRTMADASGVGECRIYAGTDTQDADAGQHACKILDPVVALLPNVDDAFMLFGFGACLRC